jgi:tetratricopeptide (TPR) repeat protein
MDDTLYRAYINRGKVYQSNEQQELAIADFQTGASLAADSQPRLAAGALINLAWFYVDSDRSFAEDYFAQAILLDPVEGYSQRGLARLSNWQQITLAIDDFSKALALDNTDPYLYHFLGQAQLINNQPGDATQTYQNAITTANWRPGDKENLVNDLRILEKDPKLHQAVLLIRDKLESAKLP